MPLFLQAFSLFLNTFWRYVVTPSFQVALSCGISFLVASLPLGLIGALLTSLLAATIPMLITPTGIYCALTARGHYVEMSTGRILWAR